MTKRLGILIAVIVALVAGGLARARPDVELPRHRHQTHPCGPHLHRATGADDPADCRASTGDNRPVDDDPAAHGATPAAPSADNGPSGGSAADNGPPVAPPPAIVNGIAQDNGGDQDADNNGGPSDGDGNL